MQVIETFKFLTYFELRESFHYDRWFIFKIQKEE
jgi:hypothetical protein